jgi:hypothetical protein
MHFNEPLPESQLERAKMLQNILIARATSTSGDNVGYAMLRELFINDNELRPLLPDFVRTCRDLSQFWGHIKEHCDKSYQERRNYIWKAFAPLLDHLEGKGGAPGDESISDALSSFDADGVHALWEKALKRREADPEGAITLARTMLERVCKRILDETGVSYNETDELPALYGAVAKRLNIAPSQHTEETFKVILGSCQQVVERLGSLRNRISDAHASGGKPVRPAPRHAALAVNLAGAMATFLVETWQARQEG